MKRNVRIGAGFVAALVVLGAGSMILDRHSTVSASSVMAPRFEVDPMWPKPLPNHWVIGMTIGVSADAKDNIWIIHRQGSLEPKEVYQIAKPTSAADCCTPAPPVLEFDQEGNLLQHWGGPGAGYDWPDSNHGITVDYKGNVWIGGNGRGPQPTPVKEETGITAEASSVAPRFKDNEILKFTQDGKFLMQIGHSGAALNSNDTENLGLPAKLYVDPKTDELYVADGYGNKRVIVFDAETGKYKRHWGAFGNKPDDTNMGAYDPSKPEDQQFRNPVHCAELSHDGMVYVCDRPNDRIQVFKPDGTYVKEKILYKDTLGDGSVWDIAFSKDPAQKYIYLADGANEKIHILDRESLEVLASFGDGGRQPGEFYAVHSIATDSKGNIFTTETYRGQRIQKFQYKGLGAVTKTDEGVLWPKAAKSPLSQ
jgi:DNA-binding beta-propeller fold protein YncE